jgi:preprotein translocase subunit SecD
LLCVLAVLIIVMLAGVVRGNIVAPEKWQHSFKVGLGLDLSSGTTVTLEAVTNNHATPDQGQMTEARNIMLNRVNEAGFSGAIVQQQGNQDLVVSVPGHGAQAVAGLVGQTALLRFRQVLLCTGVVARCSAITTPAASASGSASPRPGSSAGAKSSLSPSSSRSTSPSHAPSTSAPAGAETTGDASLVSKSTLAQFGKLNCADKNWQQKIYGSSATAYDNPDKQIVTCDSSGVKYVLDIAKVTGEELTSANAALDNQKNQWVVNFSLNGNGNRAFGNLTSQMFTKYSNNGTPTSVLDDFAIVLDGKVVSAPAVSTPITGGSGQITGGGQNGFTQPQATQLANVLKYGHLPLSFRNSSTKAVSPQLGSAQLSASLTAAAIGLLLVIIYSFLYYRGLGVVSVFSLVVSALLTYLSVVLLSKYQGFTMSLAGVAGLVVAIGITADSFVVYFERLRDEVREGRSLRAAVERGWARARRTILVSDTVSFLAAALLYIFAIGDVKGFAYTLGLTTLIDVIVVFLFTKPMVTLLARTRFYGQGHPLSGLDPARLGARSPWGGGGRPPRPAAGGSATASPARSHAVSGGTSS